MTNGNTGINRSGLGVRGSGLGAEDQVAGARFQVSGAGLGARGTGLGIRCKGLRAGDRPQDSLVRRGSCGKPGFSTAVLDVRLESIVPPRDAIRRLPRPFL